MRTLATPLNQARPPRPAAIEALARGLDVPVAVVRAAAAESAGLHYYDEAAAGAPGTGDQEPDLLIASIDELPPEERLRLAALVAALRRQAPNTADKS